MPPQDADEWGLPEGADDEAADDDMGGDEVPFIRQLGTKPARQAGGA